MNEREEVLMRILIFVVGGIIIYFWTWVVVIVVLANVLVTLVKGKKINEFKEFNELYIRNVYSFWNYVTFNSDIRAFPFNSFEEIKRLEEKENKKKRER